MEGSRAVPGGAVVAEDLVALTKAWGPFVSVYLTTEAGIENAAQRSELRWKDLRRDLASQGAPPPILEAIEPLVPEAHLHGGCLAVVANLADGILHVEHGPEALSTDVAAWAPLPRLVPLLRWRQTLLPHMIVLVDRTGADLIGVARDRADVVRTAEGQDDEIRKSAPGGWSQRRYQQRAEDSWEHNADAVAREVARTAVRLRPELILVSGDVRALQYLGEAMPKEWRDAYVEIEGGGRAPDGSEEHLRERIDAQVGRLANDRTEAVMERFREELGQADLACQGAGPTLRALAAAQVEVLLVDDRPEDDRTAWFGPEPAHVAADPSTLQVVGVDRPQEARLVDAALRAALGTGAAILVTPPVGGPAEGLGAILRWGPSPAG